MFMNMMTDGDRPPLFSELCYLPMDQPGLYSGITDNHIYALAAYGGTDLPLSEADHFWTHVPEKNQASIELWIESLSFLYPLLDEYENCNSTEVREIFTNVTGSFLTFAGEQEGFYLKKSDHSICSRIIVFLRALTYFPDDWPLRSDVRDFVIAQARVLSSGELPHSGNHGIMQDIALLNAACLMNYPDCAQWIDTALDRAYTQMLDAFDDDGVNNENSSWYALFNYRLYNEIVLLCKHYGVSHPTAGLISSKIDVIEDALSWMVLPDNWITLVGDH
jgi:hypothetical protein